MCNLGFPSLANLTSHVEAMHIHLWPFRCDVCSKRFQLKDQLSNHRKIVHEKLRPHKCEICQKGFICKRDLTSHTESVHLKLRKYECEFCKKSFSCRGNLVKHTKLLHNQQFKCEVCPATVFEDFAKHLKTEHKIKPTHSCNICDKKFQRKDYLFQHKMLDHEKPLPVANI